MLLCAVGCARTPSPLAPQLHGTIGMPHRGVLTDAAALPHKGDGFVRLRTDERNFGTPRLVAAIGRAAALVAKERPGGVLSVGDLSTKKGGVLLPHLSHRTGRDADLLLYLTTLDGVPVESPGFVHVQADGLAWDEGRKQFYRLDVERQWLLVKALLMDEEARIQWVFANRIVEAMLIEWARARGEPGEVLLRAQLAMLEPQPGGAHDDHVHVRTQCSPAEVSQGCEPTGPVRSWIPLGDDAFAAPSDAELVAELLRPLEDTQLAERGTQ